MSLPLLSLCRLFRRSLSTGTLTRYLDKSAKGCYKDPFLQPIERPAVLNDIPEYTIAKEDDNRKPDLSQQDCFAVVKLGAHQFKVTPDDKIYVEKIPSLDVQTVINLHRVLVWASRDDTVVGRPFIPGAIVRALVEEQCEDATVTVFKMKRRKNYRRTKYHTQELTGVRILSICDMETIVNASEMNDGEVLQQK